MKSVKVASVHCHECCSNHVVFGNKKVRTNPTYNHFRMSLKVAQKYCKKYYGQNSGIVLFRNIQIRVIFILYEHNNLSSSADTLLSTSFKNIFNKMYKTNSVIH